MHKAVPIMPRGFKLLKKYKGHNFSVKLFLHNHARYSVVLKVSVWKLTVYKKVYLYDNLALAEKIYNRILQTKHIEAQYAHQAA